MISTDVPGCLLRSTSLPVYQPTRSEGFGGWLRRRDPEDHSCGSRLEWVHKSVRAEANVGALLLGIHQNHPVTKAL